MWYALLLVLFPTQMRYMFVIVDCSQVMSDKDLKPNRLTCTLKVLTYTFHSFATYSVVTNYVCVASLLGVPICFMCESQ